MILSYCEISATPQFQFLITELSPRLGDKADKEAYRDYMEFGKLREPDEILNKMERDHFSTVVKPEMSMSSLNELTISKKDMFADIGKSNPGLKVSDAQIKILRQAISKANNTFARQGVNKVYKLEDVKQVGQADIFTYKLTAYKGKLDTETKAKKASNNSLERNSLPSYLEQGAMDFHSAQDYLFGFATEVNYSQEIIRKMATALGQQVGVDFAFISPSEARDITKGSQNPYVDQKSFFFNGKVYFVKLLTPNDVLHEFVHPIIKNIAGANKPLFNSLYDKVAVSEEGKQVIEDVHILYPDLDIVGDDFKEEVLVRSLEKAHDLDSKGLESTTNFKKYVNDLLYAIKQLLRKIFGQKIKVSDLSPQTTILELSDILAEGGSFELDPEIITDNDLVAYKNEYNRYLKDFVAEKADAKEVEKLTNDYFDAVSLFLKNAREKKDLGALADVLQNKYKTGEFEKIKNNLKSYQTLILQDSKVMEDEVELTRERVTAIVNSMSNLDNMALKLSEGLEELVKDIDDPDNVQRVLYYQRVLNYWSGFVKTANSVLRENGVRNLKMIESITTNVDNANALVEKFYEKASKDVLWKQLNNTAENIDRKWEARIKELETKKAPTAIIEKAKTDYKNEKITPDMIEKALKGQLKDVSLAGAFMEGYSYNPDPVVGGLAAFYKNGITDMEINSQRNLNEATLKLKPLLDKAGFNPNKSFELGEKVGQKEKAGRINPETGEFETVEKWVFKNLFTGSDYARSQYEYKIKQASIKFGETHSEEDKKALADIQSEWEDHQRKFFNTKYTEQFYKAYDLLKNDELGREVKAQMNNLYDQLNILSGEMGSATANDVLEIADQIESVRREIKQLSSLYDLAGEEKTGDELAVAKRLQEFNDAIKDIYESEEIPDALQLAYQAYEQKLLDEGKKKGEFDYEDLLTKWKEKNLRSTVKDAFWDKMDLLSTAIKNILSTIPQQDAYNLEIEEAYKTIKELVKGNRDESGQPLGSELSIEKQNKIKVAQERINTARENLNRMSGLSKAEQNELNAIMAKLHIPGQNMTQKDSLNLGRLLDKQGSLRLGKIQRAELNSLFNELEELRTKEPTDSYVDTINNFLDTIDPEIVDKAVSGLIIDKATAYMMGNIDRVQRLFDASPEFEEWFKRNHILKETVDMQTNEPKEVWERTYAWNVIKPRDAKYYETTTIKNLAGENITLQGLPSLKYFKRLVKDEYLTPEIEGVTKDNRGYWLPKNQEQGRRDGGWDDRYINKEYQRLRTVDPVTYELLEALKIIHLKSQEGLERNRKLGLDFPRYAKQSVERLRGNKPISEITQRMKNFFSGIKTGWETDFNRDDSIELVRLDLFDDGTPKTPIGGIANIDINEVSTDIVYSTMRYMLAAEKNKTLAKMAPVAKMLQEVVNNEKNYPFEQKMLNNSTLVQTGKRKEKYVRAKAVNNFIEKNFEGQINTGLGSESAIAQKFSNFIFRRASTTFLAFNIPSAIKNTVGMKFQGLVESVAGKHMSTRDFIAAEGVATATTLKISSEIYKQGPKSLDLQIVEIYDFERDRFVSSFGQALVRTPGKDTIMLMDRLTDFRKASQLQAALQTGFGMLKHQKVPLVKDGKTTMISAQDMWELNKDQKIQLKVGIDPTYGITYDDAGNQIIGEKFKQKRNEFQRVMDNLNGAMSRDDSPEANRYLLFRYVSFFRRFMTSMITNRFAYSGSLLKGNSRGRFDYQLGDTKEGFYITFLKTFIKTIKNIGRNLPYASTEEKQAFLRIMTEVGTVAILKFAVLPLIFGWDDDDKDRFKKLRAKSGAIPLPFVAEDPRYPFHLWGWLENHAMLNIMQINNENDQFLPFPGLGLNNYKENMDIKSMAFGPTIKTWFDLINDVYYLSTGDDKAYYKKDSGPYEWSQEGEKKIWSHIAKSFGFTGSTIDPSNAAKNFQSIQNR